MQKFKIIAVFIIILMAIGAILFEEYNTPYAFKTSSSKESSPSFIKHPVPSISFSTLDGQNHMLSEMKEEIVLLHFWASWCGTCIAEFPDLLKLVESFNGRLALIAVSIDDREVLMSRFMAKLEKKAPELYSSPHIYWVWDKDKSLSLTRFNVVRLPETVFIDHNRMMTDKIAGRYDWFSDKTKQKLEALASKTKEEEKDSH